MYLALREGPAENPKWYEKVTSWVIETRLQTKWPHAGIVVGDTLYHASAKGGLQAVPFVKTDIWTLYDCGTQHDSRVIKQFNERLEKAGGEVRYDWFSLLAFTPAKYLGKLFNSPLRYNKWLYCYEWCFEVLKRQRVTKEVTPEDLLQIYIEDYLPHVGEANAK